MEQTSLREWRRLTKSWPMQRLSCWNRERTSMLVIRLMIRSTPLMPRAPCYLLLRRMAGEAAQRLTEDRGHLSFVPTAKWRTRTSRITAQRNAQFRGGTMTGSWQHSKRMEVLASYVAEKVMKLDTITWLWRTTRTSQSRRRSRSRSRPRQQRSREEVMRFPTDPALPAKSNADMATAVVTSSRKAPANGGTLRRTLRR